jgi:branched-chain amino acid transport system permease protein
LKKKENPRRDKVLDEILIFIALHQKIVILVILLFSLFVPFVVRNSYFMRLITTSLIFCILALSFNFISGFMGQLSMAHAAFFGIGSYTTAIVTKYWPDIQRLPYNIGTLPAMLLSCIVAGFFGLLISLPTLRLKGFYLAIVTMGFAEIVRLIEINEMGITRGVMGIPNIPPPDFFGFQVASREGFYYMALVMVVVATFILRSILRSRMGRAIMSIRGDDIAAEAMGINVFKYKVMTFIIATVMAGFSGSFYAMYFSYIDPSNFSQEISTKIMSMVLFGGLGSFTGSFLGAFSLSILPELTRNLSQYRFLFYGAVIVLVMLIHPVGLMGSINFDHIRDLALDRKKAASGAVSADRLSPSEKD